MKCTDPELKSVLQAVSMMYLKQFPDATSEKSGQSVDGLNSEDSQPV